MSLLPLILLFIISLLANIFSAFAGGGAGLLQFPALIMLGLNFKVALATHKIASVALGLGASLRHWREGTLHWRLSLFILASGIPGVVLGAWFILDVPEPWPRYALGVLTISLGIYSFINKELGLVVQQRSHGMPGQLVGGLVLFIIGVLNGSLASGTGLFCTLWLVAWFGLDYKRAVAHTLVLVGLFWNGSGAITLGVLGEVQWSWLPVLLLGSVLGGYIGAHWSLLKGSRVIKRVYELVTVLAGLMLLFKTQILQLLPAH